jgi:hypothetical protein
MLIYLGLFKLYQKMTGGIIEGIFIGKMAGARQWLPGIENFFTSLEGDLCRAVRTSINCDIESAQYWLARLENIEEIQARAYEAYRNRHHLLDLITHLLNAVRRLTVLFGITALRTAELVEPSDIDVTRAPVHHSDEVGRPCCRYSVTESQLRFLHDDLGLRWVDIASCLAVSERTLRRWRYQFGMMTNRNFTNLSNERLDEHVRDILNTTPSVGLNMMRGALRARRLNIQRERVRESINRVDPVSRTVRHTQFIIR